MSSRKISSRYGLCGGMCAGAYDFTLAGRGTPQNPEAPNQGTRLQRYFFQRQMDSLGGLGQEVVKVAQWTGLPDDTLVGSQRRTADEFKPIREKLEHKNLVVLALIYEHATSLAELSRLIFNNHQVLAYACQADASGGYAIRVYDPNLPMQDDVVIQCEPILLGDSLSPDGSQAVMGFKSNQLVGNTFYKQIRGFFAMPYFPVKPPKGI